MSRYDTLSSMIGKQPQSGQTNPERGCGQLVAGKYYLRQDSTSGGSLAWLTFTWGTHVAGMANIFAPETAERGITFFNPAASFALGTVVPCNFPIAFDDERQRDGYVELVQRVGKVGILDFVGAKHYTPWSFIEESWQHGVSRRVSGNIAHATIAKLPIPIFFCHKLPVFDDSSHRDIHDPVGSLGPVWQHESWSMFAKSGYCGDDHYMLPLVKSIGKRGLSGVLHEVAIFMASWITSVGKAVNTLEEMENETGIMPLLVGEKNVEQ